MNEKRERERVGEASELETRLCVCAVRAAPAAGMPVLQLLVDDHRLPAPAAAAAPAARKPVLQLLVGDRRLPAPPAAAAPALRTYASRGKTQQQQPQPQQVPQQVPQKQPQQVPQQVPQKQPQQKQPQQVPQQQQPRPSRSREERIERAVARRMPREADPLGAAGSHVCEECGKQYGHPMSLIQHRKTHQGSTTCPVCHKVMNRTHDLKIHLALKHGAAGANIAGAKRGADKDPIG
ncbi:Protein glass [Frankliniella fusca]|uniref:Protein glass n=1 Tax=Frankliniella fusca TaxID=407009 RepID=A0AAE1LKQ2_9NEOP|nr:Protein glass [Frankliniella fusca]